MCKKSKNILKFLFMSRSFPPLLRLWRTGSVGLFLVISITFLNLLAVKPTVFTTEEEERAKKVSSQIYIETYHPDPEPKPEDIKSLDRLKALFSSTKNTLEELQKLLNKLSKYTAQHPFKKIKNVSDRIRELLNKFKDIILCINYYINEVIKEKKIEIVRAKKVEIEKTLEDLRSQLENEKKTVLGEAEKFAKQLINLKDPLGQIFQKIDKLQNLMMSADSLDEIKKIINEIIAAIGQLPADVKVSAKLTKTIGKVQKILENIEAQEKAQ